MPTAVLRRTGRPATLVLSLALLGAGLPRTALAQDLMTSVTDKHMESVLNDMGVDFTKTKDHTWRLTLEGYKVLLLLLHDNTDAQLYVGFGDKTVSAGKMNEWNKGKRFGRAYADDDSNPALESDLDFAGGVSDNVLKAWIKLYKTQVTTFVKFLNS